MRVSIRLCFQGEQQTLHLKRIMSVHNPEADLARQIGRLAASLAYYDFTELNDRGLVGIIGMSAMISLA